MTDNITQEENSLLSDGNPEGQQGQLLHLLTPVLTCLNSNMTTNVSMTWTNVAIKRQNLPRKDHTICLNQASPVTQMTCLRRSKRPKIKTQTRPRVRTMCLITLLNHSKRPSGPQNWSRNNLQTLPTKAAFTNLAMTS